MSSTGGWVRSRRSRQPCVAVVHAATPVGRAVTRALVARMQTGDGVSKVVAIDSRAGSAEGVSWRMADVTDPAVAQALAGVDVVVHPATPTDLQGALDTDPQIRRSAAVRSVQAVVTAAAAVGVRRVVAVSSAMVYGAPADNPVPLPDTAPLRAAPDAGLVGDLLEVEAVLARTPQVHRGLSVTVLRPAALVGEGVDTVVTRHFEAPRLLALRESDNRWQFCHVDDLASAVVVCITAGLDGVVTVGSPGSLTQGDVERISGMRRVELPSGLAFSTAERLHRVGVLPMPASDLSFVVHPWVVSTTRLDGAGWRPQLDNETCLGVLLADIRGRHALAARRVDRKDAAAVGAAGAAVALIGTAALWRQARVRQGRRR